MSAGGDSECSECKLNAKPNDSKSACTPCSICAVGHGLLTPCNVTTDTICRECEAGEYSSGGLGACKPCKENEISNGAKSACIQCASCPAGTHIKIACSRETETACQPCAEGSYQDEVSRLECKTCPPGKYCPRAGLSAPLPCPKGSFCEERATQPAACSSGEHYCPEGSSGPLNCPEGATCSVPASPEILIEYKGSFDAVVEKRESEVNGTKALSYQLSLSAAPAEPVSVIVSKEHNQAASCVHYDDGIALQEKHFTFNASNWNETQTVTVILWRIPNVYQGPTITRFKHSVALSSTDDNDCQRRYRVH